MLTIAVVNEFEQVPAAVSVRIVLVSIRRINVYFFVKQENETGRHRIIVVHHTIADVADAEALSFCGRPRNDSRHPLERISDSLGHSHM